MLSLGRPFRRCRAESPHRSSHLRSAPLRGAFPTGGRATHPGYRSGGTARLRQADEDSRADQAARGKPRFHGSEIIERHLAALGNVKEASHAVMGVSLGNSHGNPRKWESGGIPPQDGNSHDLRCHRLRRAERIVSDRLCMPFLRRPFGGSRQGVQLFPLRRSDEDRARQATLRLRNPSLAPAALPLHGQSGEEAGQLGRHHHRRC